MSRLLPRPAQVGLAAVAAYTVGLAALFACSRYPYEYLEGVLVDAARRIVAGEPLYCDLATLPCVLLPHPPVYVGVVAALGKLSSPELSVGRFVSVAGLFASLGLLYALARRQVGRRAAIVAPALYLVFVEVGYFSSLMRPEALAFALELAAVLLVLSSESGRTWLPRVVGGALLLVLALFTKPNLLAGPLALALILARKDLKRAAVFAGSAAIAAIFVLESADHVTGGLFIKNHVIAHTARIYSLTQFFRILWYGALPWLPLLLIAVVVAAREARRKAYDFPVVFFFCALGWCLFSGSLQGSAAYYYFELYAAAALLVATRLPALEASRAAFGRLAAGAIWLQIALSIVVNPLIGGERYRSYLRLWRDAPELLGRLASAPGLVLVEDPIVAAAARRPLLAEIFMDTQLAKKGRWDQRPILEQLENGGISRVVLRDTPVEDASWLQLERFTPAMLRAIAGHYRLEWSDATWFVYAYEPPR